MTQDTDGKVALDHPRSPESAAGAQTYGIIDPEYARIFTIARLLAWSEGYALMMHGSFTRDLDLIAVPWTDAACEPEHLVRRLLSSTGLLRAIHRDDLEPGPSSEHPHGRLVWTLVFKAFGDPRFVDFSVAARISAPAQVIEPAAVVRDVANLESSETKHGN